MALPADLSTWFAARTGQGVKVTTATGTIDVIPVEVFDDAVRIVTYSPASGSVPPSTQPELIELSTITDVSKPRPA
jgi:hypothetical protein